MIKFYGQKNRGFTLIETLVAISIFVTSLLGLISISSKGIADTGYAKRKIIASYLAQEGIEQIRNLRDTYVLYDATSTDAGWGDFKTRIVNAPASCAGANGCYLGSLSSGSFTDPTQPMKDITINACSDSTCSTNPILYESTTGKYTYTPSGSTSNSGFTRKTRIVNSLPLGDEVKISSTVYWKQGLVTYNVTFTESLFNWNE